MPAPLDVKKVRKALVADPAFSAAMPEEAQPLYLELVDALPKVLEAMRRATPFTRKARRSGPFKK